MALSLSFKDKRVLITGAGRGLGRDLVQALYHAGADIIGVGRNQENLDQLKVDFPRITVIQADLGNWEETRRKLEGKVEGVEYLINNAGMVHPSNLMDITEKMFDDMWNVNVKGVINVSQIVVEAMIRRGKGGCVINISSLGAKMAAPMLGIYDTTKASLDMLTKSMAVELGAHGIRVNSVNPTVFETDMTRTFLSKNKNGGDRYLERTPMKRIVESYEVVNTIMFLMSDHCPFINAETVLIDGGWCAN